MFRFNEQIFFYFWYSFKHFLKNEFAFKNVLCRGILTKDLNIINGQSYLSHVALNVPCTHNAQSSNRPNINSRSTTCGNKKAITRM